MSLVSLMSLLCFPFLLRSYPAALPEPFQLGAEASVLGLEGGALLGGLAGFNRLLQSPLQILDGRQPFTRHGIDDDEGIAILIHAEQKLCGLGEKTPLAVRLRQMFRPARKSKWRGIGRLELASRV